ncbi:hypothetical protein F4774DRAFT_407827 [Daldinia eschscholtzii]|nr:hypothetical protein F4774DRAFT_407827 [Daldinia eschscholtzii]
MPVEAFIHGVTVGQVSISLIVAAAKETCQSGVTSSPYNQSYDPPFSCVYFPSATLRNANCIQVFNGEHWYCRGILLDYTNGAQRALGQCRIGVDSVQSYAMPAYFYFRYAIFEWEGRQCRAAVVKCTYRNKHYHDEG